MEKLSSGYRINRAADDAAGLAISEKMRGQIGGLAQAQRNAQDGISLVQTAEGALNEVHSMLQRVRDLKVQFDNGTLSDDDRTAIAARGLRDRQGGQASIADQTKFNGKDLFSATATTFTFQVGANDGETITTSSAVLCGNFAGGGLSELTNLASAAGASAAAVLGRRCRRPSSIDDAMRERLQDPRQLRRGPEPSGAPSGQPGDLPGEPDGVRVADPRRGHGG